MNVIVTNNKVEYNGFIKLSTLREASELVGNIEYLVYNKSNESREDRVSYLTKLKDRVKTLIYIRKKEAFEQDIQIIVVGSGGKCFDDEFFLENSDELAKLIDSLDEVVAIAELGGVNVVSDFFNRYLKNGSTGFNPAYLMVVKNAVSDMITTYKQKEFEILQLSETATEIFASSAEIVSKVENEMEKLKTIAANLESAKNKQVVVTQNVSSVPNVVFFPQINYLKERTIIRIKCIGECPFIVSFILGFRIYLERIKNTRPKVLFIEPIGAQYETIYKDFKWVTQSTHRNMGNYYDGVVFTNYPNKDVLMRLLDDTDYDTFVVVDMLKNSSQHILNSKGPSVKYAVSGQGIIDRFKLKTEDCLSIIKKIEGSMFTVPVFPDYPVEFDQRERLYLRVCAENYNMLYNLAVSKRR